MGVDTAYDDAVARSTRANLEVDTTAICCESQRRQKRLGVCMLNALVPERLQGGVEWSSDHGYACSLKKLGTERPFHRNLDHVVDKERSKSERLNELCSKRER